MRPRWRNCRTQILRRGARGKLGAIAGGDCYSLGMGQAYFSTSHLPPHGKADPENHLQDVTEAAPREFARPLPPSLVATRKPSEKSISRGPCMNGLSDNPCRPRTVRNCNGLGGWRSARMRRDPARAPSTICGEQVESSLAVIRNMALLLRPAIARRSRTSRRGSAGWRREKISRPTRHAHCRYGPTICRPICPMSTRRCVFRIAPGKRSTTCKKHANRE